MRKSINQVLALLASFQLVLVSTQEQERIAVKGEEPPADVVKKCAEHDPPDVANKINDHWGCHRCAEVPYKDPETGLGGCCHTGEQFAVDKTETKKGACCPTDQIYAYDASASKGSCCASGQVFKNATCVADDGENYEVYSGDGVGGRRGGGYGFSCQTCSNKYTCACGGDIGLQYGHCYTMTDVNGLHLNRQLDNVYQSGGEIDNLIFKVCHSTADCDERMGDLVADDGTWFLQDQLGPVGGLTGPGWFGYPAAAHMMAVDFERKDLAAEFKGEAFCMYGDCAICLRLIYTNALTGLVSPCPMGTIPEKAHIGRSLNPNNCKAYRFQEVNCVKGVPAKPTK